MAEKTYVVNIVMMGGSIGGLLQKYQLPKVSIVIHILHGTSTLYHMLYALLVATHMLQNTMMQASFMHPLVVGSIVQTYVGNYHHFPNRQQFLFLL